MVILRSSVLERVGSPILHGTGHSLTGPGLYTPIFLMSIHTLSHALSLSQGEVK